jgi:hypothetical protein
MIREPLFCCHDCCQKQRATTRRNLEIANLRNSTSARRQVKLPPMTGVSSPHKKWRAPQPTPFVKYSRTVGRPFFASPPVLVAASP